MVFVTVALETDTPSMQPFVLTTDYGVGQALAA